MPKHKFITKTGIAKTITRFVVGSSSVYTAKQVIKNNTLPETEIQRIKINIGAFAIGAIASESAGKFTDKMIDEIIEAFQVGMASVQNTEEPAEEPS